MWLKHCSAMLFWFKKLNASTSLKARLLCSLNFCFSLVSLLVCCTATFFLHISYADITLKYISQFFCFFWLHKMLLIVISTIARRIHQIILPSLHLLFNFLTYHTSKVSVRSVSLISLEEKLRQKKKKKRFGKSTLSQQQIWEYNQNSWLPAQCLQYGRSLSEKELCYSIFIL